MSRARDVASNNLAVDTTPTLQGDLTMGSNSIADGVLPVKNTGSAPSELRLYCESSNAHYVGLKSPAHSAFSGNHTITMPPNTGTSGQLLSTDGNGVTSWADAGGGSRTLISSTDMAGVSTISRTADFSTTYSRYEIELRQYHLDLSSAGVSRTYMKMKFIDDQGTVLGSGSDVYRMQSLFGDYAGQTGRSSWFWAYYGGNFGQMGYASNNQATLGDVNGRYYNTNLSVFDPAKAIVESGDTINSTTNQVNAKIYHQGAGVNDILEFAKSYLSYDSQTRRITGIQFHLNDGSFTSGKLLVWGVGS